MCCRRQGNHVHCPLQMPSLRTHGLEMEYWGSWGSSSFLAITLLCDFEQVTHPLWASVSLDTAKGCGLEII